MTTVPEMLENSVSRFPRKTALIFNSKSVTYQEFSLEVEEAVKRLVSLGVKRGDRVCLYLGNRLEFIYLHFAVMKLGAVVVPVNVTYRMRELKHSVEDSGASLFITDDKAFERFSKVRQSLQNRPATVIISDKAYGEDMIRYDDITSSPHTPSVQEADPDDLAAIIYTSGTTGRSKGATLTHVNFTSNIRDLASVWKWASSDRLLLALPLFHVHGLGVVLHGVVYTGGSLVLMERFDAEWALRLISEYRCNVFMGVPTMYSMLLDVREPSRFDLSHIRLFVSGSAPLPVKVFKEFSGKYGFEIVERYGLTETIMNISNPVEGVRKPGSVGLPLPSVSVKIVGEDGQELAPKQVGEILVKGPNVTKGYWNMKEATREAFSEGWFKTGDLGYVGEDGYISITGRKKEMIIVSGFKVYPREVEEVLSQHPKVKETAVIGVPDPVKGETVKAFVVPQAEELLREGELLEYCRHNLASFKVPSSVELIDVLPKTASGKIIKSALQQPKAASSKSLKKRATSETPHK